MDLFWENEGWELEDKHLSALRSAPFKRKIKNSLFEDGLYVIRGPRQIGKSSYLKELLADFKEPQKAFYLSCENIRDFKELTELINSIKKSRSFILLDEITFVDGWSRSIKHLIDSGYKGKVIITGSHAVDIRKGTDLMPGRISKTHEIYMMPMNLIEYREARKEAGWKELSHSELVTSYLRTGGFPVAVAEGGDKAILPKIAFDTYKRWLVGDILKLGKQELYLREILGQLALTMTSSISLQKLSQRTQIGSHNTVQEYISILEDRFALRTCYAIDENDSSYRFKKEKKFYFTDPIVFWIALEWSGILIPEDHQVMLAEMVAHEELTTWNKDKNFRFGYHKSKKGEIDFFSPKNWAIEVKWSEIAHNISRAFLDCTLPNRILWMKDNLGAEWPREY